MTENTPNIFGRIDEVIQFRGSLTSESDRGCALMAASYLDGELEKLLRDYLVPDTQVANSLFRSDGALGSFGSRIDLAYLLGLIGVSARRDLHLIRKMRNEFGHIAKPISFDDEAMVNRCRELYHSNLDPAVDPRTKFTNVVLGVTATLHGAQLTVCQLAPADDLEIDDESRQRSRQLVQEILDHITQSDET